jgi:nucleoside-triphosphatase THEP1
MSKIVIFTDTIRSGKTTILLNNFKDRDDTSGFICPDVSGMRYFFDLKAKKLFPFEIQNSCEREQTVYIGKFKFSKAIFEYAHDILYNGIPSESRYFIIDEIGKLELQHLGFEPALSIFLTHFNRIAFECTLIVVVRDTLLKDVIQKYSLRDAKIISLSTFDFGIL